MKSVVLGKSELQSSRLAYGAWRIAGTWEPAAVTSESRAAGQQSLLAAFDAGYTLFDLADIYCGGIAEEIFGSLLTENPTLRSQMVIATKCGIRKAGEPRQKAPYRYDFSREYIIASCEGSLKRLHTDCVDLYQLHRPDFLGDPQEVAAAFESLKKSGKVLHFGVSNFNPIQVETLQRHCPMPLIVNQVEISLARIDTLLDGTLDQCLRDQITPLAWSPLARGKLGTVQHTDHEHHELPIPSTLNQTLQELAHDYATTASVIALAWLLKHPAGIVPIIGSTNPQRIREATTAESIDLSREDWYRLMEAAYGKRLP